MLLTNTTQVIFTLDIKLTFDNGTTKVGTIKEGDYLLLKFRYNGEKLYRACRVVAIYPVQLNTQPISWTASLLVDCSSKFSSERLRVASKDILNIRFVDRDYIESLAPEYDITEEIIRQDAIPATPDEDYEKPGVDIAGVDGARILR